MAMNTIIQQGKFTASGSAETLVLRSDVDFLNVYNYTQAAAQQAAGRGIQFYWQRGMATDSAFEYKKTNNTDALNLVAITTGGFTLLNTSETSLGALNSTITAVTTDAIPSVTLTSTSGISEDSVVRLANTTGALQLGGYDFTVDSVVANTSMDLAFMTDIVVAATAGDLRVVNTDPMFYPRRRFISIIDKAATTEISLTVTHGFTVGQSVRVIVPDVFGMVEIDGMVGTIIAIEPVTNTITLDIDSTGFTAFAFPLTAVVPFSPALIVPVGEAAQDPYANLLDDATINLSMIGMELAAGAQSPAGSEDDVIYWTAGKSFSVTN